MKATGIVRRIDDLGRVVIPKEIRRTMHIREGEPLEIFTTAEGEVIFKKYSPVGELSGEAKQVVDAIHRTGGLVCAVCDRDHVVAAGGSAKKELAERRITPALEKVMETRRVFVQGQSTTLPEVTPVEGFAAYAMVVAPILSGGDIAGAVVALSADKSSRPSETDVKLVSLCASFLGKQVEE